MQINNNHALSLHLIDKKQKCEILITLKKGWNERKIPFQATVPLRLDRAGASFKVATLEAP